MKRQLYFLFAILLFSLAIVQSQEYKEAFQELLFLFYSFFIPALFPTIFLTLVMSKTIKFGSIKNAFMRKLIFVLLALIGGTLTTNAMVSHIDNNNKDKCKYLALLSGGSIGFLLFIFKSIDNGLLMMITYLICKLITCLIILPSIDIKNEHEDDKYLSISLEESVLALVNMFKSMLVVTMVIPVIKLLNYELISNYLLGLIEFSRATIKLCKVSTTLSLVLSFQIIEFNGLCSIYQIKKSHHQIGLVNYLCYKIPVSLFYSLIPSVFF